MNSMGFSTFLTDPSIDNQMKFSNLVNQYSEHLITKDEFEDQMKSLIKNPDWLSAIESVLLSNGGQKGSIFDNSESKILTRHKSKRWTPEEDQKLCEAVQKHGTTYWSEVAAFVGNGRTSAQCSQRWNRVLDPRIIKTNWTKEEEEKLLKAVEKFGDKAWTRIAQEFGNRSDVQCRFKYHYIKKKSVGQTETLDQQINDMPLVVLPQTTMDLDPSTS